MQVRARTKCATRALSRAAYDKVTPAKRCVSVCISHRRLWFSVHIAKKALVSCAHRIKRLWFSVHKSHRRLWARTKCATRALSRAAYDKVRPPRTTLGP